MNLRTTPIRCLALRSSLAAGVIVVTLALTGEAFVALTIKLAGITEHVAPVGTPVQLTVVWPLMLCQRFGRPTPGDTALTRIGANSTAKPRVNTSMAPQTLAATTHPLCGRCPATPVVCVAP